jgi:hypothetical protein
MRKKLTAADILPSKQDYEECGLPYVAPRKAGYVVSEPGESGYRYAIFSRTDVEAAYGPITDENAEDIAGNLTNWGEYHGGPGRGFSCVPWIRAFKRNVIVRQFSGLDI